MRRSTFISALLHLAILLWAVTVFPKAKVDPPALLEIPVDVAPPSELTKLKAGMVDAKDDAPLAAKPEPPKPAPVTEKEPPKPEEQQAAAPPPPPPPPPPKQEPPKKPDPAPDKTASAAAKPDKPEKPKDPPKKAEAKPDKPKPVKDDKPKPKPSMPAPEAKRDFNTDRIAALLNKIPEAAHQPKAADASPQASNKPVHGQSNGTQQTMSVNEIDALRAKIAQCWSPPPGGLGADAIVVKLRLRLNEDGSLVGYPTVENSGGSAFFQAAADSAVRAVYQCQPYTLPSDKYQLWRDMILNFDPSQMYSSG